MIPRTACAMASTSRRFDELGGNPFGSAAVQLVESWIQLQDCRASLDDWLAGLRLLDSAGGQTWLKEGSMPVRIQVSQVIDRPLAEVFHFYAHDHARNHPR